MLPRRLLLVCLALIPCATLQADLVEYVAKPDPTYSWTALQDGQTDDGVAYTELLMTSQTWRGIAWKHKVMIVRPAGAAKASHALLIVAGGSWREGEDQRKLKTDSREFGIARAIAGAARMPVAFVLQVPFQPLFDGMYEDALIAHTFKEFMQSGERDWPLLLPMTKTAVRAMDTVQAYAKKEWQQEIKDFLVCGGSKRGWTTWLTGAVDPRVKGIAPMVFDTLKLPEQMKHQKETWGTYSEQIADYTKLNLTEQFDTPPGRKLVALVDPYAYRSKLTMPKLLVFGTNDRYWPLDALNLYWPDLEGEKYILYVPNAGHGINDFIRLTADISAFSLKVAGRLKFPKLTWDLKDTEHGARLAIRSDIKPVTVSAWTAQSPTRDFRDARWRSADLTAREDEYVYEWAKPQSGFAAAFGEVYYELDGRPLYLSTNVRIVGAK